MSGLTPEQQMAALRDALTDLRDVWAKKEEEFRPVNSRRSDMAFGATAAYTTALEVMDKIIGADQ